MKQTTKRFAALLLATGTVHTAAAGDCDKAALLRFLKDNPDMVYRGCMNWDIPAAAIVNTNTIMQDRQGIGCRFILMDLHERYNIQPNNIMVISKYAPPLVGTIKFDVLQARQIGTSRCHGILIGQFDGGGKALPLSWEIGGVYGQSGGEYSIDKKWTQDEIDAVNQEIKKEQSN